MTASHPARPRPPPDPATFPPGQRISLRFRDDTGAGPVFRDVVGDIISSTPQSVSVFSRRGPVEVRIADIVAVRAVPPPAPRRRPLAAIVRVEAICADAWPAIVDRRLGQWRLRAAGGYTNRANSALAIGDPGMPIPAALQVVREFAEEHGIAARVQVPIGSPWDRSIDRAGWVLDRRHPSGAESIVLVGPVDGEPDSRVEITDRCPDPWWRLGPADPPTAEQRRVIEPDGPPRTAFALWADQNDAPAGHLRAALVDDHLHLSQLAVAEGRRRQGVATALVGAAGAWARDRGARSAVLQVVTQAEPALAFYRDLAFVEHHRYRYLVPA